MKKLLIVIVIGFVAYFIWPTRYAVYAPGEGPYGAQVDAPTRVDRLTGEGAMLTQTGAWKPLGNTRKATAFEQPAVDPNATRRPSNVHNQQVRAQQQQSVQSTQQAVDAATQQNP